MKPTTKTPLDDYAIVPLVWEFNISHGQTVLLNGTAQKVHSQLNEIDPNYAFIDNFSTDVEDSCREVSTPKTFPEPQHYLCWKDEMYQAVDNSVCDGIKYLRKVGGRPKSSPGPRKCGRVSCSYHSAIYWCNDDTHDATLDSFSDIADGAATILANCDWDWEKLVVTGQVFHPVKPWNVIVKHDDC